MTSSSSSRQDAYLTYRFMVEIKSIAELFCTECRGLEAEIEFEEVQEGGLYGFIHRLPKNISRSPNLVLTHGLANNTLWDWYQKTASGFITRQNATITLFHFDESLTVRWNITGVLPAKWSAPSFNTGESQVAFETLELVHMGIQRAT